MSVTASRIFLSAVQSVIIIACIWYAVFLYYADIYANRWVFIPLLLLLAFVTFYYLLRNLFAGIVAVRAARAATRHEE